MASKTSCRRCGKQFECQFLCDLHWILFHSARKSFVCPFCLLEFGRGTFKIVNHLLDVHPTICEDVGIIPPKRHADGISAKCQVEEQLNHEQISMCMSRVAELILGKITSDELEQWPSPVLQKAIEYDDVFLKDLGGESIDARDFCMKASQKMSCCPNCRGGLPRYFVNRIWYQIHAAILHGLQGAMTHAHHFVDFCDKNNWVCDICELKFRSKVVYFQHYATLHGGSFRSDMFAKKQRIQPASPESLSQPGIATPAYITDLESLPSDLNQEFLPSASSVLSSQPAFLPTTVPLLLSEQPQPAVSNAITANNRFLFSQLSQSNFDVGFPNGGLHAPGMSLELNMNLNPSFPIAGGENPATSLPLPSRLTMDCPQNPHSFISEMPSDSDRIVVRDNDNMPQFITRRTTNSALMSDHTRYYLPGIAPSVCEVATNCTAGVPSTSVAPFSEPVRYPKPTESVLPTSYDGLNLDQATVTDSAVIGNSGAVVHNVIEHPSTIKDVSGKAVENFRISGMHRLQKRVMSETTDSRPLAFSSYATCGLSTDKASSRKLKASFSLYKRKIRILTKERRFDEERSGSAEPATPSLSENPSDQRIPKNPNDLLQCTEGLSAGDDAIADLLNYGQHESHDVCIVEKDSSSGFEPMPFAAYSTDSRTLDESAHTSSFSGVSATAPSVCRDIEDPQCRSSYGNGDTTAGSTGNYMPFASYAECQPESSLSIMESRPMPDLGQGFKGCPEYNVSFEDQQPNNSVSMNRYKDSKTSLQVDQSIINSVTGTLASFGTMHNDKPAKVTVSSKETTPASDRSLNSTPVADKQPKARKIAQVKRRRIGSSGVARSTAASSSDAAVGLFMSPEFLNRPDPSQTIPPSVGDVDSTRRLVGRADKCINSIPKEIGQPGTYSIEDIAAIKKYLRHRSEIENEEALREFLQVAGPTNRASSAAKELEPEIVDNGDVTVTESSQEDMLHPVMQTGIILPDSLRDTANGILTTLTDECIFEHGQTRKVVVESVE